MIENSINRGTIDADMNVGGIAGTMGVENLLDPEEDNKDEGTSLLRTSYTVSAVLVGNTNEGSVTAKKDMVGGIVGQEELGLVTACESYGDVTGVNQVGGIAGAASAKLRSNWAKCALSGEKYVGGIVGQGSDSDLTDGSLIAINNCALVSVLAGQQYVGAISGGQDGSFVGNLFVSDDLQGIDRLSRAGQAEPVTYETLLAQEGLPTAFRKLNLVFKADGHTIKKISFDYGASFTEADYPEIPQKEGYYAEWSTPVLDALHTDTVVNVEYTSYIPALGSSVTRENGRPVFYVDGFFGGSNAVQVTQQDITADVHGVTEQWLLEFTDDGNETHQIDRQPARLSAGPGGELTAEGPGLLGGGSGSGEADRSPMWIWRTRRSPCPSALCWRRLLPRRTRSNPLENLFYKGSAVCCGASFFCGPGPVPAFFGDAGQKACKRTREKEKNQKNIGKKCDRTCQGREN